MLCVSFISATFNDDPTLTKPTLLRGAAAVLIVGCNVLSLTWAAVLLLQSSLQELYLTRHSLLSKSFSLSDTLESTRPVPLNALDRLYLILTRWLHRAGVMEEPKRRVNAQRQMGAALAQVTNELRMTSAGLATENPLARRRDSYGGHTRRQSGTGSSNTKHNNSTSTAGATIAGARRRGPQHRLRNEIERVGRANPLLTMYSSASATASRASESVVGQAGASSTDSDTT